jgi:hypothetical protein
MKLSLSQSSATSLLNERLKFHMKVVCTCDKEEEQVFFRVKVFT